MQTTHSHTQTQGQSVPIGSEIENDMEIDHRDNLGPCAKGKQRRPGQSLMVTQPSSSG